MSVNSNTIEESSIPELKLPSFSANIPSYILEELDGKDRWLHENISILAQTTNWVANTLLEVNKEQRKTNGKIKLHTSQINSINAQLQKLEAQYIQIKNDLIDEEKFFKAFNDAKARENIKKERKFLKFLYRWRLIISIVGTALTTAGALYFYLR